MEVQMNSRTESCSVTISKESLFPRLYVIIRDCRTLDGEFGVAVCRSESLMDYGLTPEQSDAVRKLAIGESHRYFYEGVVTRIS